MKKNLLILMTLFTAVIGYSQTFTDANFIEYTVIQSTNTVQVTDYDYANGGATVNIPATVDHNSATYNVTEIGSSAFLSNSLTNVTIPSSVTVIGPNAFRNNNLISVTIPDSVITIGNSSFAYNSLMISVQLSNNLISIDDNAFTFNNLQSLTIPNNVLTIGENAFSNNNLASIVIGNNVISIGEQAFRSNTISNLVIPSSVTSIGDASFLFNPLVDVYSESTVPPTITTSVSLDTFAFNRGTIHLHIPANTMGAYVTDTGALWTGFNPVTEDASLSVSDFELANNVTVITNTDELKIISSGTSKLKSYTIYSIAGAKVKEGKGSTIAIEALSNGIYVLGLTFDTGKLAKKFAK